MKKKIINGILMSALLLAGTTSFVSCKDNIDDEAAGIRTDIASLDGALGKLDGRVGILETTVAGHTDSIKNLRNDLTALAKRVRQNEIDIDSLEVYYQRLAKRVSDMENYVKTMEVGVIVQGTIDPVLGSANGFVINQKTLCGFVGKNGTGITEFPEIGGDSDINGGALTADEVPAADYVEFNPDNKYLNDYVKLGSVFVTLNPIGADATKVNFSLQNTAGKSNGVEFGTPEANDVILTKSFLSRHLKFDLDARDEFPLVWEIPVQLATTGQDFESNMFDYLSFGDEHAKYGKWNLGNLSASFQDVWKGLTDDNTPRYQKGAEALSKINKIFAAIKDGIDCNYAKLNNYGILVTNPESGREIFGEADIISVVMEPISYKTAQLFDQAGIKWDLTNLKAELKKYIENEIQSKFPKANINNIQLVRSGGGIVVIIDTDKPEPGVDPQHYEIAVPGSSFPGTLTDEQLARYGSLLNDALAKYRYLTGSDASELNPLVDNVVNKIQNYLNLMTGELVNVYYNGHVAMTCVEPMLLTEATNASGVTGIVELKDASYGIPNRCVAGDYLFALTSLLQDYIVPVYKKYIGVVKDGKLMDGNYTIADGDQQMFALTIPEGESTIVIQTLDYAGNTFTKKYLIKADAK